MRVLTFTKKQYIMQRKVTNSGELLRWGLEAGLARGRIRHDAPIFEERRFHLHIPLPPRRYALHHAPLPSPSCRSALFARRFVGGRPDWAQIESPDNLTTENRRTASPPPEKRLTGENESSARCRRALEKLPGLPFCSRFGPSRVEGAAGRHPERKPQTSSLAQDDRQGTASAQEDDPPLAPLQS